MEPKTIGERAWRLWPIIAVVLLAGCATQTSAAADDPPGFWMGLVHGFLVFFSLIGSLFTDVRIYAFPNTGFWYDLGYFFGASAFLGGSHSGVRQCVPNNSERDSRSGGRHEKTGE